MCFLFHLSDKAPFSKSLLIIPSALAFLLAVPFSQYKSLFMYNLHTIKQEFQSFLLCSWVFSALFDTLLVEALHYACDVKVDVLPSGL
ncbi:UNVERIFIED_CONTAM: hypothetical protein FKN15_024442 [Acipenser sinensis]